MATLTIRFMEGFDGDRAEILVDGDPVDGVDDLRTDYSIGLARSVTTEIPDGPVRLDVVVPGRGLRTGLRHAGSEALSLDVRVTPEGSLEQSPTPEEPELY